MSSGIWSPCKCGMLRANPRQALALFRGGGMCYNRRAVESAAKQEPAPPGREPVKVAAEQAATAQGYPPAAVQADDASRYCPVCSQRLESRRCKLICGTCGYYMSCADYY